MKNPAINKLSDHKQQLIVVVGMHRSGTSVITRGLHALGVNLGERLLPPALGINDKGFWEDIDVNEISDAVLRQQGRSWDHLAPISWPDIELATLRPFIDKGVQILSAKLKDTRVFGLKNPRITRLLPFWKRVFEQLSVRVSYVIALRHPLSVSESLTVRDGFAPLKGWLLWLEHMVEAVTETADCPRLVVDYDAIMERPVDELRRIAAVLDLPFDCHSDAISEFANEFIEPRLRHSRHGLADLHAAIGNLLPIASVFETLQQAANDQIGLDNPAVAMTFHENSCEIARLSPLLSYVGNSEFRLRTTIDALAAEIDEARCAHAARDEIEKVLRQTIVDREAEVDVARNTINALATEIDEARRAHAARDEIEKVLRQTIVDREAEVDVARNTINALATEIDEARRAHAARDEIEKVLRQTIVDREAEVDVARNMINALATEIDEERRAQAARDEIESQLRRRVHEQERFISHIERKLAFRALRYFRLL